MVFRTLEAVTCIVIHEHTLPPVNLKIVSRTQFLLFIKRLLIYTMCMYSVLNNPNPREAGMHMNRIPSAYICYMCFSVCLYLLCDAMEKETIYIRREDDVTIWGKQLKPHPWELHFGASIYRLRLLQTYTYIDIVYICDWAESKRTDTQ